MVNHHNGQVRVVELDICPSCGREATLDDYYGWCLACVGEATGRKLCPSCGIRLAPKDRHCCRVCSERDNHSEDAIHLIMAEQSVTYRAARTLLYEAKRPTCVCCGGTIPRSKPGAKFCSTKLECIEAKRVFRKLRRKNKNGTRPSEEVAIRIAIGGIHLGKGEMIR